MSSQPFSPVFASAALPTVDTIFERLAAGGLSFKPRPAQLRLAQCVRNTLATGGIVCLEAPTGTGKTLGYLAGGIEQQAHEAVPLPIVVATATVGLQEQILRYDVPRLVQAGVLDARKVALAKGRSRYFCPRTTSVLEDKKMQDGQFDMFDAEKFVSDGGTHIALDMLKAWRTKTWDGDQDSWPGAIPQCWGATCACSSDTCIGRNCDYYDACPYIQSRARLAKATLVIANQDIVLADLRQRAEEQESTALPFKKYALIVDEAHHFPDKAADTRRGSAKLGDGPFLEEIRQFGTTVWAEPTVAKGLAKKAVRPTIFSDDLTQLQELLQAATAAISAQQAFRADGVSTWGLESPGDSLLAQVGELAARTLQLADILKIVAAEFTTFIEPAVGPQKAFGVRMLALAHRFYGRVRTLQEGLALFYLGQDQVRWATRDAGGHITLHTQPLEGDRVLEELLWRTQFPVALVSATLQVAGSFARFKARAGLPLHAVCEALPPVFDYSRGFLHEPLMRTLPGDEGHDAELVEKIQLLFEHSPIPGMLVLFTAKQALQRVVRALDGPIAARLLVAGSAPLPELVAKHKAAIDRGQRSVLVGLDSMAEGLDLPGKYCGHVVITRLPFAVPDDPVEAARQTQLKGAWFEKVYLADMLTKLIQGTGRLIRREEDHGVISLLDGRLANKYYAPLVFAALPRFTRISKLGAYKLAAQANGWDITHGYQAAAEAARAQAKPALAATNLQPIPAGKIKKAPQLVVADAVLADRRAEALAALAEAAAKPGLPWVLPPALPGELPLARLGRAYTPNPEVPVLSDTVQPCLPRHAAPMLWAEGLLPEAVLLGLVALNRPGYQPRAEWHKILAARPDIFQFAYILRSHDRSLPDARCEVLSSKMCTEALTQAFAGLKLPDRMALALAVNELEQQAGLALTSVAPKWPSRAYLEALVDYGTVQIQVLRSAKKRG